MNNKIAGIIAIILGLIIIICPLAGFVAMDWVIAISIILLGIYALIAGCMGETDFVNIILGILFIIFGIILFFNPLLLSFVTAFINYFVGILLIVLSIVNLFTKGDGKYISIIGIIFGIIAIIFGYLALNPLFLGIIIGVWFLIAGIMKVALPDIE
ncbi:MAG: DUF308 domain-containing protein [Methanobacteriaceae archaeon]|nr:DUF308 domain-containing protein [Methanobacteriaceae archaeon]